jgi:hypothetical protein
LDFNDQVYFYVHHSDLTVEIFEAYKICGIPSASVKATILPFGVYSSAAGLDVTQEEIWQRRRDFQVNEYPKVVL